MNIEKYDIKDFENGLLDRIDISFIESISNNIPYMNIYYLVCMAEVVNMIVNEEVVITENQSLLEFINNKATELYNGSDISEYLYNFIH